MLDRIFKWTFGQNNAERITDNAAHTGGTGFYAITAMKDSTISAATAPGYTGTLVGMVIPAGITIYGQIDSITFSGAPDVIAYKR